jgi:DNA-binding NtrC family response regulator
MKKQKPRNLNVVVAEKNSEARFALCSLITSLNCVAIPTCSGLETMMAIKQESVALVLLDVDLTLPNQENTLHEIRQVVPMLPVIMMSGVMTPAFARRLGDRGAQGFLVKPIQRDQLAMTLFRYLL